MTESSAPHRIDEGVRWRTVMTFQLLLGSVMLLAAVVIVTVGTVDHPALLVTGFTLTAVTTAAALLLSWDRLPRSASAIVPALDFVAIGMLRESSDVPGLGLLWAFVAMWAAWSFGVLGTALSMGAISLTYWTLNLAEPQPLPAGVALIFPLIVAILALLTLLMARRAEAQRALLEKQSRALQRAASRAREQETLLAGVLDAVDFGVVRFDRRGVATVTNEMHDGLRLDAHHADDPVYAADGITRLPSSAFPVPRARRGEVFDGALIWFGEPGSPDRRAVQATARRVLDDAGEDAGAILVSRDATSEQLALRARDDLVASVSHELRTPLTSILGYLELALDDHQLTPGTRRGLQVAERNAGRLLELIGDILAESVASRVGIELHIEQRPAEIAALVLAAVEAAEPRAAARAMTIDRTGVEPVLATVDAPRLRQVVDNLIGNAIKYGNDGGRIEVGCTVEREHALIAVRDDGPGIAPDDIPHLFQRFYRSERVRKTAIHGSGLGLAISRDIVRAHQGEIVVRSELGVGTTFLVRLPLTGAEARPSATSTERPAP